MRKVLRGYTKVADKYGFTYAGYRKGPGSGPGSGHYVFSNDAGSTVTLASTPKNEGTAVRNAAIAFARHADRSATAAELFRKWLLAKYKIGRRGAKQVELSIREITDEYNAAHPDHQITRSHVGVITREGVMFERIAAGTGGAVGRKPTVVLIKGPLYGLEDEPEDVVEDACGAELVIQGGGIAVCTMIEGHPGLHFDSLRQRRWPEGAKDWQPETSEPEPRIDETAAKALRALPRIEDQLTVSEPLVASEPTMTPAPPVLEPVSVSGITLSAELVSQLQEALGVSTQQQIQLAKKAVADAEQALAIARDALNGVTAPLKRRPEASRIGRVLHSRIKRINELVKAGTVVEPFSYHDLEPILQERRGQIESTLAKGTIEGHFRRVGHGLYEVV